MDDVSAPPVWNVDEEEEVCRVCRTEAEDNKPLIYPCKCSGSVRYVHSDCLQEWLLHSRKRYCEICGHYYKFTKVYPASLPSTIPAVVYVRQSLLVAGQIAWRFLRVWIAIVSWLVVLPCVTMISLRAILYVADYLTFPSLSYGVRNAISDSHAELNSTFSLLNDTETANLTANVAGRELVLKVIAANETLNIIPSFADRISWDPQNMIAFVFRGQIVATSIAAGLIGLILLREWIGQIDWNARPTPRDEEPLRTEEWLFRNGQAVRILRTPDAEVKDAPIAPIAAGQQDNNDALPVEEIAAVEDNEAPFAGEANEPRPNSINAHATFVAPEQLDELIPATPEQSHIDAGPSRSTPDVPQDAIPWPSHSTDDWQAEAYSNSAAGPSTPFSQSETAGISNPAEPTEGPAFSQDASESNALTDGQLWKDPEPSGQHTVDDFVDGQEDYDDLSPLPMVSCPSASPVASPDLRRASDPGPSHSKDVRPAERQYGSQGHTSQFFADAVEEHHMEDDDHPVSPVALPPAGIDNAMSPVALPPADDEDVVNMMPVEQPQNNMPVPIPQLPGVELARVDTDIDTDAADEVDGDPDEEPEEEDNAQAAVEAAFAELRAVDDMGIMEMDDLDPLRLDVAQEDDDDRPLDADDWDGIFEVMGIIGPLTGLLHNLIFVSIAMACTLGIIVGLPVIVGKIVLSTDPIRASGDLLLLVIRTTRLVCEVVLNVGFAVFKEVLAIPRLLLKPVSKFTLGSLNKQHTQLGLFNLTLHSAKDLWDPLKHVSAINHTSPKLDFAATTALDAFAALGGTAHHLYKVTRLLCISVAASPSYSDQMWCLVTGYLFFMVAVLGVAVADSAKLINLSPGFVERAQSIQMFLKVVFFMTVEIVVFPLFVGTVLNLCTLPVFGATVSDRLRQGCERPFGTLFTAWLIGTIFMFSFAAFLKHMRTICRPGALYFIRDPSDPSHSPVKDIMERPALAQLPRLAMSAVMYALLVFFVCGLVPLSLMVVNNLVGGFLPLQLYQHPLTSVPFDLLFLHLVLPPSWENLRLPHRFSKALDKWWKFAVRRLDLSCLILPSKNHARPESRAMQLFWLVTDAVCQAVFGHYDNRATLARVPATDRVELLDLHERRRDGMLIALDHAGAPRTPADRLRLLKQDRAALRAGRNPKRDYTMVHMPDYWRTRVYMLIFLSLLTASFTAGAIVFLPIVIGRQTVSRLFGTTVFDGYNWLIGVYICWGSYSLGRTTRKKILQLSRAQRLRRSKSSTRFKRAIIQALRRAYAVVMLFGVVPLLAGINIELSLSLPIRYGFSRDVAPVLHIWDAWGMGLAFIILFVGTVGLIDNHRHNHRLTATERVRDVFKHPLDQHFKRVNRVMWPVAGFLIVLIVLPWAMHVLVYGVFSAVGLHVRNIDTTFSFRAIYPITTAVTLGYTIWLLMGDTIARARQWIIDAEYVVEEIVENYEPTSGDGDIIGTDVERELGDMGWELAEQQEELEAIPEL